MPIGIRSRLKATQAQIRQPAIKQPAAKETDEVQRQRRNYLMNASEKQKQIDLQDDLPFSIRKKLKEK